jgi:hypothetical protein
MALRFMFLFSLILMIIGVATAQNPPAREPDFIPERWKEFVAPDGTFRVLMPGVPTEASQSVDARTSITVQVYGLMTKTAEYSVGYTDFAKDLEHMQSSKLTLDGLRDRVLANENAKLLSEQDISMAGHPGRTLTMEVSDGIFRDVCFVVGNRLYTASIFTPTVNLASQTDPEGIRKSQETVARRFLDSFKLLIK